MAPLMGEALAIAGDAKLSLVMDNNAWAQAEQQLDQSILEIMAYLAGCAELQRPAKNSTMRALLWAATRRHHPELTIDACGDLLVKYNDLHGPLCEAIGGSLRWAKDDAPGEA